MSRRFNLAGLLALLLAAVCLFASAALAETAAIPAGYEQVAENSRFNLYLHRESLAIIVESKATGGVMYSTLQDPKNHKLAGDWQTFYQSGVVLEYIENLKASPAQANPLKNETEITYDLQDNGFTAHVNYKDIGISHDLILTMDEAGLHVSVPQDSFQEVKEAPYMIVKDENGAEIRIDLKKYEKTANKDEYVLIDAEGKEYVLAEANFVAKKGTKAINVLASDGVTQVTVPADKALETVPVITVTDENGQSVQLAADKVTAFRTNVYVTGADVNGNAFRYPEASVVEKSENSYTVAGIYVFPMLGYTYMGEEDGYMIIPDGQGAIVKLENNEKRYKSPYVRQVYGTNIGVDGVVYSASTVPVENVIMPVFGMVHTADQIGFLGVIEEGDYSAQIMAYMNGNTVSNFDWICAKYTYRLVYNQPMGMNGSAAAGTVPTRTEKPRDLDVKQHFLLTDGAEANYAGLAVAYRDYLISKGTFAKASDRPFDVQLDFLGMERENYIFGKKDVVMTSYEQAQDILKELKAGGVDEMSVVLRGWQEDGLTGGVPAISFDPAKSLGGKKGLKELREYAEGEGIDFALEADVLSLNTETHPTLTYSAFKLITSATWSRPTFGKVYDTLRYLTPSVSAETAEKLVQELAEDEVKGVSFTGITQLLADYYYKDKYHDTSEMASIYEGIVKAAGDKLTVTLSSPNAYLWPYADVITDLPIGGSDHTYTDVEIPFLAIALSGQVPCYTEYVNFQANTKEFFLHLMEQGTRPAFLLTWEDPIELQDTNSADIYSSRYELYKEMIETWYQDLSALHEAVGEKGMIVNHERSGSMVRVTWDNGTKVYLNFGDKEATFDGVTLDKLAWKVVSANGK